MIFVDTSVWVGFFRGRDARLAAHLSQLLDRDGVALAAPVRIELLSGASRTNWSALHRALSAPPLFYPGRATWQMVESMVERGANTGHRFGVGDLLIAAIAAQERSSVWSLDGDFPRMAALGFVKVYAPPAK